jgi:hypothetical protein
MNNMQKLYRLTAAVSFLVLPCSVHSHHSNSEYDRSVVTEFDGEIVSVSWRNPHIQLKVSTIDAGGQPITWNVEGAAVSAQRRHGVTAGLVSVGDQVRIAGAVSSRRSGYMIVDHILLPSGIELLVGSSRQARWSETAIGGNPWSVDPDKAATARGTGIFRVWSRDSRTWYFRPADQYRLTESALAAVAEWDEFEDNPLLDCFAPGMPALMGNPYPMEFVERGNTIELRFEEFDAVRVINLSGGASAESIDASPLGYSVGRWEGNTLLVATSKIDWPYFDRVGISQSDKVEVYEKFRVVEDGNGLEYEMTVTDPQTLLEPFVWQGRWAWRPGEEVNRYDCTLEE